MDDTRVDVGVRDNRAIGRYEVVELDTTSTLDYRDEHRLVLAAMHVPQSIDESGHHVGGKLFRAAIARARAEDLTLVASFPFARRWLRDNPEDWVGVTVDWSTGDLTRE